MGRRGGAPPKNGFAWAAKVISNTNKMKKAGNRQADPVTRRCIVAFERGCHAACLQGGARPGRRTDTVTSRA